MAIEVLIIIIIIINNNGLLTVHPPSGASPVKNYNIKSEKLQYTTKNKLAYLKDSNAAAHSVDTGIS